MDIKIPNPMGGKPLFQTGESELNEAQAEVMGEELAKDQALDNQREIQAEMQQPNPYAEQDTAAALTELEHRKYLIDPTAINTTYHQRLTKEEVLSNLRDEQIEYVDRLNDFISNLLFYGLTDIADIFHQKKMNYLRLNRSTGGWQQNTLRTNNTNTSKVVHVNTGQGPQQPLA